MLRSFGMGMILATTIVVQCTGQKPELGKAEKIPETFRQTKSVNRISQASPTPSSLLQITPTASPSTATDSLPDCVQSDCNCTDFSTQKEAQVVLDAFPNDPHGLDKNKDGVACEGLQKRMSEKYQKLLQSPPTPLNKGGES
jgi:hypothetical protein